MNINEPYTGYNEPSIDDEPQILVAARPLRPSENSLVVEVISLGEDSFAFCVGKLLRFAVDL